MKHFLAAAAVGLAVGLASAPRPATAYPIDCAILLCLAGGWPPSAPCAAARAEFMRRITPWPIEPPLQIWRCPMGVAYRDEAPEGPLARLRRVADGAALSPSAGAAPLTVQVHEMADYSRPGGSADIDISDPAFDFVRSIRVFSVEELRQKRKVSGDNADCLRSVRIRVGRYRQQGDFYWSSGDPTLLPDAYVGDELFGQDCPQVASRAVFVDWRDHGGTYGFEQVNY